MDIQSCSKPRGKTTAHPPSTPTCRCHLRGRSGGGGGEGEGGSIQQDTGKGEISDNSAVQ